MSCQIINFMKHQILLNWTILISLLVFGWVIHKKLDEISIDIKNSKFVKLEITNVDQFDQLCKQFNSQWNGSGYAIYILQPNAKIKTHKELASTTIKGMPILLKINTYEEMEDNTSYYSGNSETFSKVIDDSVKIDKNFAMIPIYRHNVVIAEFYILYEDTIPSTFDNRVTEAQQLSQLIR